MTMYNLYTMAKLLQHVASQANGGNIGAAIHNAIGNNFRTNEYERGLSNVRNALLKDGRLEPSYMPGYA